MFLSGNRCPFLLHIGLVGLKRATALNSALTPMHVLSADNATDMEEPL